VAFSLFFYKDFPYADMKLLFYAEYCIIFMLPLEKKKRSHGRFLLENASFSKNLFLHQEIFA